MPITLGFSLPESVRHPWREVGFALLSGCEGQLMVGWGFQPLGSLWGTWGARVEGQHGVFPRRAIAGGVLVRSGRTGASGMGVLGFREVIANAALPLTWGPVEAGASRAGEGDLEEWLAPAVLT